MQFSRAVAFACFTALKWLTVLMCVLFAALALRFHFDGEASRSIGGAVAAALASGVSAYILDRLAIHIRG